MKKIILLLITYFLLGCISVSANRYLPHSRAYSTPGPMTLCDEDVASPDAPGTCVQIGGLPAVQTAGPCTASSIPVSPSGTMTCLYWDKELPTISTTYPNDVWRSGTQNITLNTGDTGGSGIDYTKRCEGSSLCTPTNIYTGPISKGGNYNSTIRFQTWDKAGNASTIGSVIVKIDNTPPTVSDITGIVPNGNFLATSSQNYGVAVSAAGGSPIVSAFSFFEDHSKSDNSFISPSKNCIPFCNQNIQNVDNNRDADGGREYSLRVSRVCDEVGNCLGDGLQSTNLKTFNVYVYSNTSGTNMVGSVVTNQLTNSSNVADGTTKNLIIRLTDTYGNIVIPATGISRTIDFTFNTDNDLYLNQYINPKNNLNGVYLNTTTDLNYQNRFPLGVSTNTFSTQDSTDGNYNYQFKVYIPTKNVDTKAYGNFAFYDYTKANITGTIGNNSNFSLGNSIFSAKFLPIYYTTLSGGIIRDGMIEGAVQSSNIEVFKNPTSVTTSLENLDIEFGSGNSNSNNINLNLEYSKNLLSVTGAVGEGNTNRTNFINGFSPINYSIFTKLKLVAGTLSDIQNSYFSTHISYSILDPDGYSITPVLNSDVYGKDSYWGTIGTGGTYASAVKVIGKTYSKSFTSILQNQSSTQVNLLNGSITKSSLKTEVRRNAYNLIRNTPLTTTGTVINVPNDFLTNTDGIKLLSGGILYFGGLDGANVTIENQLEIVGNKTILVEGGNLYIKKNINVSGNKSLLSIVVLKDINGNGGNVYIDPSVSYIKSIIYADKSLISYDGTTELGGNTEFSVLRNQLYILGSVFSENTTGGSRSSPIKCPYYVSSCLDQETAQIYDLNYLRRYYLKDTNSDGTGDTPAGVGTTSYFSSGSPNYKYPLIIEYNPLIQTDPPFIFRK